MKNKDMTRSATVDEGLSDLHNATYEEIRTNKVNFKSSVVKAKKQQQQQQRRQWMQLWQRCS